MTIWNYPNLNPSWNISKGTLLKKREINGNLTVNYLEIPIYNDSGKADKSDVDSIKADVTTAKEDAASAKTTADATAEEVNSARGGEGTLGNRLDKFTTDLAEIAS